MTDLARLALDTDPLDRDQLAAMARELARLAALKLAADHAFLAQLRDTLGTSPVDGERLGREIVAWAEGWDALNARSMDHLAAIAAGVPAGDVHH